MAYRTWKSKTTKTQVIITRHEKTMGVLPINEHKFAKRLMKQLNALEGAAKASAVFMFSEFCDRANGVDYVGRVDHVSPQQPVTTRTEVGHMPTISPTCRPDPIGEPVMLGIERPKPNHNQPDMFDYEPSNDDLKGATLDV